MVETRTLLIFNFNFKFACHGHLQNKNGCSTHTRIDGSILAVVFLTSSFCVVPESSDSSNTASSTYLIVHVELGTQTAANSTKSTVHGFLQRLPYYRRWPETLAVVQLHRSLHSECLTTQYCVTFVVTVNGEFFGEPNTVFHAKWAGNL